MQVRRGTIQEGDRVKMEHSLLKVSWTDLRADKQGWIHGMTVADGCRGAIMQKTIAIQKCVG